MKPIQIMMDEDILSELDKDKNVLRHGRSAVFRQMAAEYLKRKKEKEISSLYRKAYGNGKDILGNDFECWEQEGVWPAD